MTFSERLIKSIEKRGISRYRISQDTKITEATLSNYCNGKGNPSPSIVKQLSDYLKIDYYWLLNGEAREGKNLLTDKTILYKKKDLNKADINTILTALQEDSRKKDEMILLFNKIIEKLDILIEKK
jgi:transcriptional regulator with XRE-family HTH domain